MIWGWWGEYGEMTAGEQNEGAWKKMTKGEGIKENILSKSNFRGVMNSKKITGCGTLTLPPYPSSLPHQLYVEEVLTYSP